MPPPGRGSARERTALAWNRSGLALLVAVAIMLRRLWPLQGDASVVVLVVMAAGALVWAVGLLMTRRSRFDLAGTGTVSASTFRLLTIGTVILAVAGFLLGLLALP
jgi:uncharacterized membrane protein YidH (DUF202 family)